MGMQERDYEKRIDEKPLRVGRVLTTGNSAGWSWKKRVRDSLVWIVICFILLAIFNHYKVQQKTHNKPVEVVPAAIVMPRHCELLPPNGSSYVMDPSVMKRTDVLYSGLEIQNQHNHPMVAILSDSTCDSPWSCHGDLISL